MHEDSPLLGFHDSIDHSIDDNNKYSILVQWKWTRWQSLSSVCMYVSVAGTTYAFAVYSTLLKSKLGFSQESLDIVASVGNTGLYLSIIAGLILEKFNLKFVVTLGGFFIFIGFLYIFLSVQGLIYTNLWLISIFYFISQFGVCCHVSSAVTYCVRLFPSESRGASVGLGKGYFALSSAVLGDFAGGYFSSSSPYFILFIALMIPCVGITGAHFANIIPDHLLSFDYEKKNGHIITLVPFFIHWMILFLLLFFVGYSQFAWNISNSWIATLLATTIAMCIISIQLLPSIYGRIIPVESVIINKTDLSAISSELEDIEDDNPNNKKLDVNLNKKECFYGKSVPLSESIKSWRFWSVYFMFLIMMGTGLMVIDNINAIAESIGEYPSNFFVTLVSLANGIGRFVTGILSDKVASFVSKTTLLWIFCLLMCLAQFLFSFGSTTLLYPCLLSVGFIFGSCVSLTAVIMADIFGSRFIATNFGLIDSAPIIGSYIFVSAIVALFYSDNTVDDQGGLSCVGVGCFRYSFLTNALSCLIATALIFNLDRNTKIDNTNSGGH